MKLNLYSISDKYIKYLRQFDDKIYDNKDMLKIELEAKKQKCKI